MIVLDTNVLSEMIRSRPDERVLAWLGARPAEELCTTAVSVQESFFGAEVLPDSVRKRELLARLESLYESIPVLPYDETCARYTAVILARTRTKGQPMHQADAQIAGIALRHGAELATRNISDFAHSGVTVLDPWRRPPAAPTT